MVSSNFQITDTTEQKLVETIAGYQPDMIDFCSRLLQTPSVNGVHDELGIVKVIAEQAESLGLHTQITGENPNRPNLIVSTSEEGETGLLLIGHTDTVPPGDESRWTHPPFSGAVADGKIYGRGAVDTKGGMTSALYALGALKQTGGLRSKRAQLICVPDEETGATGTLGIKYLHENGLLSGQGAIYAYSGSTIFVGHRGLTRYKIICEGESEHTGSTMWQSGESGANAVTGMADLLLRLEAHTFPYSETPHFDPFRTMITPGTVIHGGTSINMVPDTCEALVDIRTTPEVDFERIEAVMQKHIDAVRETRPRLQFRLEVLNHVSAAIADTSAPIFWTLRDVTTALTGHEPSLAVAGPANEGYLLIERGIPTVCGFGPNGANFHGIDEYVEIDGLVSAAQIFALTAHRLA
jgi:succinyl-diaminopimelate desuccinylase